MVPAYRTVAIDCFRDTLGRYTSGYAFVAVDVVRAMTTAVTAVALGRRCFAAPTVAAALQRAARLERPLLVGELGGELPAGFELGNSPAELARRTDLDRPIVLVSSSGTPLLDRAGGCGPTYLGCFRNSRFLGRWLAGRHRRVAVLGAASRGEFREEDQMCCAQIAAGLMAAGYAPQDRTTAELVERWGDAPADAWLGSNSVTYLRRTGLVDDLEFILRHVHDLSTVFEVRYGEVVAVRETAGAAA
jgi:2-phosphosulfolactate phosphatase